MLRTVLLLLLDFQVPFLLSYDGGNKEKIELVEERFKAASERWELGVLSPSSSLGGSIAMGVEGDDSGAQELIEEGKMHDKEWKSSQKSHRQGSSPHPCQP